MQTCRAAAGALGKPLSYKEPHQDEHDPPGCVFRVPDKDIYFNSHPKGAAHADRQRVCLAGTPAPAPESPAAAPLPGAAAPKVGSFVYGGVGSNKCPAGTYALEDGDACSAAAQALGIKLMQGAEGESSQDPKGCVFRVPDRDAYFNRHDVGGPNKSRRPICSKKAPVPASPAARSPATEANVDVAAANVSIFCFAWTPLRPSDELLLPEVRTQFRKCDGHAFFTDTTSAAAAASDRDVVRVAVPEQKTPRSDGGWLYHRNMVGVLPAWSHLLGSADLGPYDWVLHAELDHFLSPGRLRVAIAEYLNLLRAGSAHERKAVDRAMMLMFGNAFLFNAKMILEMRRQWKRLGEPAAPSTVANGCPEFMRGGMEWPLHCSQDIVYPAMVGLTVPRIAAFGRSGCGQFDARNGKGKPLPAGCWDMQKNPWGQSEQGELDAVREFAKVQALGGKRDVKRYYAGTAQAQNWELWYWAKKVPIIHHASYPSVHKLARELLRP